MAITKIHTYTNVGLKWHKITIEVDSNNALPTIEIIWLPDAAIKESKERIRGAFRNSNVTLPPKKIVLNLAPSHLKKVWTRFDLALAVWILKHMYDETMWEELHKLFSRWLFFGELWLDGSIKHITGLLPSVISAYKQWRRTFFVPRKTLSEVTCLPWITIYPLDSFSELVRYIIEWTKISCVQWNKTSRQRSDNNTNQWWFWWVKWHIFVKQALKVAASWMHNVLLVWPPWSWKTMLSKCVHSILPLLTFSESLETSSMYSLVWWLPWWASLLKRRPFRAVHHTASKVSIVGGWRMMTPWEISLAHRGILFFDELPEFPREVLEVLRQPLEDKHITISRASWSVMYPADFMFIAAMNPCKCGYYWDREKPCSCNLHDIKKYQSKISWPLIDRFDMIIEVHRESLETILEDASKSSEDQKMSIRTAWNKQKERYDAYTITMNSQLSSRQIDQFIALDDSTKSFIKNAIKSLWLSPRVMHRLIKVSRTIADMQGVDEIQSSHIAEALQYRSRQMFVI